MRGVSLFLDGIGENANREGLIDTPDRVARMCEEVLAGTAYTNAQIAEMFGKTFKQECSEGDYVLVDNITAFSYCEHHLALIYDMKIAVAYIPHGTVIGLSKIARIADMCSKRLQLQEKLGRDIAEVMQMATKSEDIAVIISAKHSCMTARGAKNTETVTKTVTMRGEFQRNSDLAEKILREIRW